MTNAKIWDIPADIGPLPLPFLSYLINHLISKRKNLFVIGILGLEAEKVNRIGNMLKIGQSANQSKLTLIKIFP